jgi:hypothetical protein
MTDGKTKLHLHAALTIWPSRWDFRFYSRILLGFGHLYINTQNTYKILQKNKYYIDYIKSAVMKVTVVHGDQSSLLGFRVDHCQ